MTRTAKAKLTTLAELDGRTLAARNVREVISSIEADLGGPDNISTARRAIIENAAVLGAVVQDMGAKWISGEQVDLNLYSTLSNRRGISYKLSEMEKSRIYQGFLPLINSGRVELLDLPKLTSQLSSLDRRTARGGRDSIDHPKGGHDDIANVCAGVAQLAVGPIPNPPAQFSTYGYYIDEPKPHRWDGPLHGGGYATTR